MSLIQYVEGDLFGKVFDWPRTVILPHVVNSKGVWGAGFVVPLGRNIPVARDLYLEWAKGSPNIQRPFELGQAQIVKYARDGKPDIFVANMLAQTLGGVRPLSYTSLVACMEEVALFARERADVPGASNRHRCSSFRIGPRRRAMGFHPGIDQGRLAESRDRRHDLLLAGTGSKNLEGQCRSQNSTTSRRALTAATTAPSLRVNAFDVILSRRAKTKRLAGCLP
jgi:hypothetical protein